MGPLILSSKNHLHEELLSLNMRQEHHWSLKKEAQKGKHKR